VAGAGQVHRIEGSIVGVRIEFIDTPGLRPAASEAAQNQRILNKARAARPSVLLPGTIACLSARGQSIQSCTFACCWRVVAHALPKHMWVQLTDWLRGPA
jgi:hypothetical protein